MKGDDAPPPRIPFDLMEEILCRLPVKYLRELRCVCKSWNSLISHDFNFAKKHLRFSTLCHHLAVSPIYSPREFYLCDSPISSFFSSVASTTTTSFTQLKHPAILNFEPKDLLERISTCDGIICFRLDASVALLINPSTRKFNFSPPMKGNHNYYTLVYDRFSNNHKIIALSLHHQNKIGVINVHTLGTDYWRKIPDVQYNVSYPKPGIFVSDTVNWLADDIAGSPRAIVYFDLEKESCQEFLCPLSHDTSGPSISLGALKDCLCIFSRNEKFSDIWIMKEYGNEKSWTKLLRVPQIGDPYAYMHTKPLYIYEDDQVLLKVKLRKLDKFTLAVYDSKNDTFRIPQIQDNIPYFVSEGIYVDSLMSP